jgi:hypothetical protein
MTMAKKSVGAKPKKRITMGFVREFDSLARKHGLEGLMIAQVKGAAAVSAAAANDGCPPGKKLTRVTFKDQFGNTITTDICL